MAKREEGAKEPAAKSAAVQKPLKAMTPAEREEALTRQRALGKQLKPLWDDIAKEPLPDDFLNILKDMAPEDGEGADGDDPTGAP